jgi:two-component system, probable response regulator PhcQ
VWAHSVNPTPNSIVLVDDEPAYAELVLQLLTRNFDCPVFSFNHPVDALHALPDLAPAVIVTDYHMPGLTGVEFIHAAAVQVPRAVFLLMSGRDVWTEVPQLAALAPLKGTLSKPFSCRKLTDEILRVWPKHYPAPPIRSLASEVIA